MSESLGASEFSNPDETGNDIFLLYVGLPPISVNGFRDLDLHHQGVRDGDRCTYGQTPDL